MSNRPINPYRSSALSASPDEEAPHTIGTIFGYGVVAGLMTGSLFGGVGVALFCSVACTRYWIVESDLGPTTFLQTLLLISVASFISGAMLGGLLGVAVGPVIGVFTAISSKSSARGIVYLSLLLCAVCGAIPGLYMLCTNSGQWFHATLGLVLGTFFGSTAGVQLASRLAKFCTISRVPRTVVLPAEQA